MQAVCGREDWDAGHRCRVSENIDGQLLSFTAEEAGCEVQGIALSMECAVGSSVEEWGDLGFLVAVQTRDWLCMGVDSWVDRATGGTVPPAQHFKRQEALFSRQPA